MSAPKPMTEERLQGIERELRAGLDMHQDATDPRGCPGPALRLAKKEIPALVAEVRRLRGEVAIWTKAELERIDARLLDVARKTGHIRAACELTVETQALLAERAILLVEKAMILKTGRPASMAMLQEPEGT